MKIKTSELTGAALDFAVAKCCLTEKDNGLRLSKNGKPTVSGDLVIPYQPSLNWAQGGPLRDKYRIDVMDFSEGADTLVAASIYTDAGVINKDGPTALIAICRAIVASKLGEEVEVPDELT